MKETNFVKIYLKIIGISFLIWVSIIAVIIFSRIIFGLENDIINRINVYALFIPEIGILFGWIPALFIADKNKHENDKKNQP